jgi:hypothetical protein
VGYRGRKGGVADLDVPFALRRFRRLLFVVPMQRSGSQMIRTHFKYFAKKTLSYRKSAEPSIFLDGTSMVYVVDAVDPMLTLGTKYGIFQ